VASLWRVHCYDEGSFMDFAKTYHGQRLTSLVARLGGLIRKAGCKVSSWNMPKEGSFKDLQYAYNARVQVMLKERDACLKKPMTVGLNYVPQKKVAVINPLEQIRTDVNTKMENFRNEHNNNLNIAKAQAAAALIAKENEMNQKMEAHANEHNQKLDVAKAEMNKKMEVYANEHSKNLDVAKAEMSEQMEAYANDHSEKLDAAKAEMNKQMQVHANEHSEKFDNANAQRLFILGEQKSLKQKVASMESEMKKNFDAQANDLKSTQTEVQDVKEATVQLQTPVAFTANFKKHYIGGLNKDGAVLKFDNVQINQGGAYNPSSGYFTAPHPGTYLFHLTLMRHSSGGNFYAGIFKGNESSRESLGITYLCCGYFRSNSVMVTVSLDAGETVYARTWGSDRVNGNKYSSFSGARLTPAGK